jgi:predicted peroxiredoxin
LGALDFLSDNNTVNIPQLIDDVIKNGVKRTEGGVLFDETKVDRIISEGVKETKLGAPDNRDYFIKDIIQNGVKHTEKSLQIDGSCVVEDVIQNGIKETHDDVYHHKGRVGGVIKNGIKETLSSIYPIERVVEKVIEVGVLEVKPAYKMIYNPMNFEPVMYEEKRIDDVTDVIRDGIKEVKELPDQSGELRGYGDYYYRQVDFTKPHNKYVDDVIESGIKKTKPMDEWVNTTNIVGKVISEGTSI